MSSDWDMPETSRPGARVRPAPEAVRAAPTPRGNGVIDPIALLRFVIGNIVKIGAIALALTAIGIVLVSLVPFPYRATATVLVDPRNQQVTLQEDVLQPIGSDAAVLESMIQIMRSDGFLRAARSLVAADGFKAATVAAIAARCQASVGSVYSYFDSRDRLLGGRRVEQRAGLAR